MHRQRSLLTGLQRCVRFASTQLRAPAPAICAVQISPKHERRGEVEDWLREGRDILQATLHSHRPPISVNTSAYIVGSDVRSCFHWVHIPAASVARSSRQGVGREMSPTLTLTLALILALTQP